MSYSPSGDAGHAFFPAAAPPLGDVVPLHPRVIAVINGKGGVGKTSVACNLAAQLARDGLRVLIIDLDPQGGVALELGMRGRAPDDPLATDEGSNFYEAVRRGTAPTPIQGVRNFRDDPESGIAGGRLDVIPGGEELDILAGSLVTWAGQGDDRLVRAISRTAWGTDPERPAGYDVVIIDSPPGQPVIQEAALAAARWVMIPAKSDAGSREGLAKVAKRFTKALQVNPELTLLGVVHFGVNKTAKATIRQSHADLVRDLALDNPSDEDVRRANEMIFKSKIRHVEASANMARDNGLLVYELVGLAEQGHRGLAVKSAPGLAEDYELLAQEVVDRLMDAEAGAE